jgi:hypothetical protein
MLNWDELTVITTEGSVPNLVGWQANPAIFSAETCMRHIYVGRSDSFGRAADALVSHNKTKTYKGAEAYCFFSEFFVGLKSHYHSDKETSGQTRSAWNDYCAKNPDDHKKLKPFVDALFADGSLVKSVILQPHLSRPTMVNTAVRMAGVSPADRVLVVGGGRDLTIELISALGHGKRHTPDVITLTHPNRAELGAIIKDVRGLVSFRSIKSELNAVAFNESLKDSNVTNIFNAQAVFVCQPMTKDAKSGLGNINQQLAEAWQLRALVDLGHDARLLHLKGNPLQRGATTGAWCEVAPDSGFISHEDIRQKNSGRNTFVKSVTQKAQEAIRHMAEARLQGDRVKSITFEADDKALTVGALGYALANRPRGFALSSAVETAES